MFEHLCRRPPGDVEQRSIRELLTLLDIEMCQLRQRGQQLREPRVRKRTDSSELKLLQVRDIAGEMSQRIIGEKRTPAKIQMHQLPGRRSATVRKRVDLGVDALDQETDVLVRDAGGIPQLQPLNRIPLEQRLHQPGIVDV